MVSKEGKGTKKMGWGRGGRDQPWVGALGGRGRRREKSGGGGGEERYRWKGKGKNPSIYPIPLHFLERERQHRNGSELSWVGRSEGGEKIPSMSTLTFILTPQVTYPKTRLPNRVSIASCSFRHLGLFYDPTQHGMAGLGWEARCWFPVVSLFLPDDDDDEEGGGAEDQGSNVF